MNIAVKLVKPDLSYKESFVQMVQELDNRNEENYNLYKESLDDFKLYIDKTKDYERGINLPEGWVPCYTYWLTDCMNNVIGVVRIRTELTSEYLKNIAGHIGYDIAPQYRRQGFGYKLLALTLEKIQDLGLKKVLITSNEDNIASIKIIEKCGGVFEKKIFDNEDNVFIKRYWLNF